MKSCSQGFLGEGFGQVPAGPRLLGAAAVGVGLGADVGGGLVDVD